MQALQGGNQELLSLLWQQVAHAAEQLFVVSNFPAPARHSTRLGRGLGRNFNSFIHKLHLIGWQAGG